MGSAGDTRPRAKEETPLRLIIAYKLVKGSLTLVLACVLFAALAFDYQDDIQTIARGVREHLAHAWAIHLADRLIDTADRRHLRIAAVALAFDGTLTFVEGWALRRGLAWAPWLVVVASGTFVPIEIAALIEHPSPGRLGVLLINAAIVYYLARRTIRERRLGAAR